MEGSGETNFSRFVGGAGVSSSKKRSHEAVGGSGDSSDDQFKPPLPPPKKQKNVAISPDTLGSLVGAVQNRYDSLFGKLGAMADPKSNSAARKTAWDNLTRDVNA